VPPVAKLIFTHVFHTQAFLKLAGSLSLLAQGTQCLGGAECLKAEPICSS